MQCPGNPLCKWLRKNENENDEKMLVNIIVVCMAFLSVVDNPFLGVNIK